MGYNKHKDSLPKDTVKFIKDIYNSIGLNMECEVKQRINGIYSSTLTDTKCGWNTCGKGTTELFCIASAYGESVEHLCNYFAYDITKLSPEAHNYLGFTRYADEKMHSISEIHSIAIDVYNDMVESYKLASSRLPTENDVYTVWSEFLEKYETPFIPYYSVKKRETVMLPDAVIATLCGSNGGGSGNTPEEAIGHGLDEILERYVKYEIYNKQLTPPRVPNEYIEQKCPELLDVINDIESIGNYRIVVKDASMGKGFSVLSVLLVDYENQRYLANFGAHPCFEIALERCLTEMFQTYMPGNKRQRKEMAKWTSYVGGSLKSTKNWVSILRDDTGIIPDSFFLEKASWEFTPWTSFQDYNNHKGMKHQINLLLKIAKDIYIRDSGFLGLPTYRIYIPGFSTSHLPLDEKHLQGFKLFKKLPEILSNCRNLSSNELVELSDKIFNPKTIVSSMIFRNMSETMTNLLYAALLYDIGKKDEARKILLAQDDKRSRCIIRDMELYKEDKTAEQRDQLLSLFYGESELEFAKYWRDRQVFASLIEKYYNQYIINNDKKSKQKSYEINSLHMKIKDKIFEKNLDQDLLSKIFDNIKS